MSKLAEYAIEDFACIHTRMATDCSQLKMAVSNDRRIQLSGIAGQLAKRASHRGNCPVISDSSRAIKNGMVAMFVA